MRFQALVTGLVLACTFSPALAVEDIPVARGTVFVHERTDIAFPAEVGDLSRTWIRDFGTGQYDVAALYESADRKTFLTLYVYRAGLPDASLWFDRLVPVMTTRQGFAPRSDASLVPAPYTPKGNGTATGLALAYDIAAGNTYAATGAVLFPHGSWLIKLRATSENLDAAQVARLLSEVERSLSLPEPGYLSAPAYVVAPCMTRLDSGRSSPIAAETGQVAAVSIMMDVGGKAVNEKGEKVALDFAHWCRDEAVEGLSVYRPNEATDRYVVTFGDGGNVLKVGIILPELPAAGPGSSVPVIFSEAPRTLLMGFFDRTPEPAAALAMADQASALAISDRDGRVTVFSDEASE